MTLIYKDGTIQLLIYAYMNYVAVKIAHSFPVIIQGNISKHLYCLLKQLSALN